MGCLPLLIQMPFFFAIFRVVSNIPKYINPDSKLFEAMCAPTTTYKMCSANALTLYEKGYTKTPEAASSLAERLPEGKDFFGLHLSQSLWRLIQDGGATTTTYIAYLVLLVMIAIASYISISRSQSLNPNASQQMKFLKYVMPFFVSISPIILPAGANLYILTSSSWRALQQEFLYRKIIIPHHEKAGTMTKHKKEEAKSDASEVNENYQAGLARKKRKKK